MADSASDARLRACGRAVMLSNHTMGDVVENYSDAERGAISRMPGAELAFRDSNGRRRLPERASFPVPKTFEGYDWSAVRLPPRLSREDVTTCAFVRKAQNLVLFGPVGTGKTHMLVAMGTVACSMGMRVRCFTTTEPVTLLSEARRDGTARKLMRSLERTDLILLDEFGYVPVDRDGARLLQVIDASYERRSLAITTNADFSRWGAVLTDDQMAAAIIDRAAHHEQLVVFEGESCRLRHALMRSSWRNREAGDFPRCEGVPNGL